MNALNRHPLDNPAWHALTTQQETLALGGTLARRYPVDVAPFAGVRNKTQDAFHELATLIPEGGFVVMQTLAPLPPMDGIHHDIVFSVVQMVEASEAGAVSAVDAANSANRIDDEGIVRLAAGDVADMVALTQRTHPGPFGKRTIETGNYLGLRVDGELVAMAGERMRLDGYAEISAVCVDERHRGKGLAARLMTLLRQQIKARGQTPFLHVKDDNAAAIALYERLGFEARQTFVMHRIAHA
ncbi:GNAT family N-acetyltransferase [Pandoraea sp. NPDC087047]|uniref:GNAT family N-acetyltransferase n=1 Tax=Pandoraea sp. NPDC087047 TaxID=3364390 RepID=UPI00380B57C4